MKVELKTTFAQYTYKITSPYLHNLIKDIKYSAPIHFARLTNGKFICIYESIDWHFKYKICTSTMMIHIKSKHHPSIVPHNSCFGITSKRALQEIFDKEKINLVIT